MDICYQAMASRLAGAEMIKLQKLSIKKNKVYENSSKTLKNNYSKKNKIKYISECTRET